MNPFMLTTIVHAKIDSVYEVVCNPEEYPRVIPCHYPSVRIMSVRGNTSVAEEHLNMGNCELVLMAKHVSFPPCRHETFVIGGDAKGMHVVHDLEEINASAVSAMLDTNDHNVIISDNKSSNLDTDSPCFSDDDAAAACDTVTVITTTITQKSNRLSVIGRMKRRARPDMKYFVTIMRDLANVAAHNDSGTLTKNP